MIFAFRRADWERYVRDVMPPEGWALQKQPHDTGTTLARFQRSTGIGAAVQPFYDDNQNPPGMLVVSSYYPRTVLPVSDELLRKIEEAARIDLGLSYSVSANRAPMPGTNLEGIDLIVTLEPKAGGR